MKEKVYRGASFIYEPDEYDDGDEEGTKCNFLER